jgi:aminoglycoside phosphotransferase (APT) family kinase protein
LTETAADLLHLLREDGVVHSPGAALTPLPGGVSSEIYRVDDGGETFVVKRALAKLKVRDDWTADISRNSYEQRYLAYVGRFLPEAVPAVRAVNPARGYFAMEYLGLDYQNWKALLLDGHFETAHARAAARTLGRIHRCSYGDARAAELFDSYACFHQLRLEPYLLTTGRRHPEFRDLFEAEAHRLAATAECLVHGDYSPKNILIGGNRMVILDCEAAWYGDPAFDVCFLLNHLFLKSLFHLREEGPAEMIGAFWREYAEASGLDLEGRVPRLLLMLLLARIDGKSPVEYLDEPRKQFARRFVCSRLRSGDFSLPELSTAWFSELAAFGGTV